MKVFVSAPLLAQLVCLFGAQSYATVPEWTVGRYVPASCLDLKNNCAATRSFVIGGNGIHSMDYRFATVTTDIGESDLNLKLRKQTRVRTSSPLDLKIKTLTVDVTPLFLNNVRYRGLLQFNHANKSVVWREDGIDTDYVNMGNPEDFKARRFAGAKALYEMHPTAVQPENRGWRPRYTYEYRKCYEFKSDQSSDAGELSYIHFGSDGVLSLGANFRIDLTRDFAHSMDLQAYHVDLKRIEGECLKTYGTVDARYNPARMQVYLKVISDIHKPENESFVVCY